MVAQRSSGKSVRPSPKRVASGAVEYRRTASPKCSMPSFVWRHKGVRAHAEKPRPATVALTAKHT